jgi:hypothetical protein
MATADRRRGFRLPFCHWHGPSLQYGGPGPVYYSRLTRRRQWQSAWVEHSQVAASSGMSAADESSTTHD